MGKKKKKTIKWHSQHSFVPYHKQLSHPVTGRNFDRVHRVPYLSTEYENTIKGDAAFPVGDGEPLFSGVHKCLEPWWKRWAKQVWYFFFGLKLNEDNFERFVGMDLADDGEDAMSVTLAKRNKKTGILYLEEMHGMQRSIFERMQENMRMSHKPIFITRTPFASPWYGKSVVDAMKEVRDHEYEKRVLGKFEDIETDCHGFMECDTCRAKAGAPYLCVSCLHNRDLIHLLRSRLEN